MSSGIGSPLIRIRSRTATMCGEVYRPTLAFGASVVSKDETKALVEPLPLVPVMCSTFIRFRSVGCFAKGRVSKSPRAARPGPVRAKLAHKGRTHRVAYPLHILELLLELDIAAFSPTFADRVNHGRVRLEAIQGVDSLSVRASRCPACHSREQGDERRAHARRKKKKNLDLFLITNIPLLS